MQDGRCSWARGGLWTESASPAARKLFSGADLESLQRGTKRSMKNTPGHLYVRKFVFSCEQSTTWHIFKNLVSSALQFMEILSHILQTDWLRVLSDDAKLHHFLLFHRWFSVKLVLTAYRTVRRHFKLEDVSLSVSKHILGIIIHDLLSDDLDNMKMILFRRVGCM